MKLAPLVAPGPPLTRPEIARYSRHLLLPDIGVTGQRRLLGARVLVVGAGGLGSSALLYLAAAGVGTIGIVDDDDVEESNLQRQIIHRADAVGTPKVDSAADAVGALNPDVLVMRHRERLTARNVDEVLTGYQIVLDGADNFPTRYLVSDAAARLGIPVVWGSILRFDAQVSVFWNAPVFADDGSAGATEAGSDAGVTLRDLFPTPPPPGSTPSCGEAGVMGALCGQVGSLMATEAIKLLTGAGEPLFGRVAVLDVLRPSLTVLPLRAASARAVTERAAAAETDPAARGYLLPAEEDAGETLEAACGQTVSMSDTNSTRRDAGDDIEQLPVTRLAEELDAREEGRAEERLVVLDVREPDEREIARIPGTIHVPLAEVLADPAGVAQANDLAGARVLAHCLGGGRSQKAAEALTAAGYPTANVVGGIRAWSEQVDPDVPRY